LIASLIGALLYLILLKSVGEGVLILVKVPPSAPN
jgi:hypothetical protein